MVLAAAIGISALAAPGGWSLAADPHTPVASDLAAMPFETPGMSFPGSAFYYLEDNPARAVALPALDPAEAPTAAGFAGRRLDAGPAALPFMLAGSGLDRARALHCLAQAVYYEAASESDAGQRAVAQVVLNRVAHPAWPDSVCGVVFEGSSRASGCQFTFTCDGSMARAPSTAGWDRARRIALRALAGEVYAPIGLATHYHTNWVNPYWAASLDQVATIGAHRFYRWRGNAGNPAAFTASYAGHERPGVPRIPATVAERRAAEVPAYAPPPTSATIAVASDAAGSAMAGQAQTTAPATAAYAGAGRVKERYATTGRWITEPGRTPD